MGVPLLYGRHRFRRFGERRLYSVGRLEGGVSPSPDDGSYLRLFPESHAPCSSSHAVAFCRRRGISRRGPLVKAHTNGFPHRSVRLGLSRNPRNYARLRTIAPTPI